MQKVYVIQTFKTATRKVLHMGDSTTKAIDRKVSATSRNCQCRTATVPDAYEKPGSGSEQKMDSIIFCIGLNDLLLGAEVNQIAKYMNSLQTSQLLYKYICSILPVTCPENTRDKITT